MQPRQTTLHSLQPSTIDIHNSVGESLLGSCQKEQCRSSFFRSIIIGTAITTAGILSTNPSNPAWAFNGGVGGLGKTKPETGVKFFGDDNNISMQNKKGIVSAEILSMSGKPILITFQAPWPLLTSSGLEARDLRNSESAFVQVLPSTKNNWKDKNVFEQLLLSSVLSSTGKFGAYGQPYNIQVKPIKSKTDENVQDFSQLFSVTFTTLTPAMRESERKVWIQSQLVDGDTLVLLVVGTTATRFPSQQATIEQVVDSFQAVKAPESQLLVR